MSQTAYTRIDANGTLGFRDNYQLAAMVWYFFLAGMMATDYYYNLTFVQFGLLDLGTRVIGMSEQRVAVDMAVPALITSVVAITFGLLMMKTAWSKQFITKLRLAFGVVMIQTVLTWAAPRISSEGGFLIWVIVAAVAMGIGVLLTFGMSVDLLPWALVLAFLASLSAVYVPLPVARINQVEIKHPVVCTSMGILVGIVGPILLVFMAFTGILIPATLIGLVIGALMAAYGWIGFGRAFARWLVDRFSLQVGRYGRAFLGTLVFMILIDLVSIVPFVGSLMALLAITIDLGAVMLTRFGLREFVPAADLLYE